MLDQFDRFLPEDIYAESDDYYVTLYLEIDDNVRRDIETEVKSRLMDAFRSIDSFEDLNKHIANKFIDDVKLQLEKLKPIPESIALFGRVNFETDKPEATDFVAEEKLKLIRLPIKVKTYIYVGRVPDFAQLLSLENQFENLLFLDIHIDKTYMYQYKDNELKLLNDVESLYDLSADEERGFMQHSPQSGAKIRYASGEEPTEIREVYKKYLNQVFDTFDETVKLPSDYNRIYVLYPKEVESFNDYMKKRLSERTNTEILFRQSDRNLDVADFVKNILIDDYHKLLKAELEDAKDSYDMYITDWQDILEASRQGKIAKLFVNNEAEQWGYIDQGLPYAVAKEGSHQIENLRPWVVLKTYEQDGKIYFTHNMEGSNIAALLRFK